MADAAVVDDRRLGRLLEIATLVLAGVLALRAPGLGDYPTDAGPALAAIGHGHVSGFFAHQPAMGALSLYLRAPFAVVAVAMHDGPVGIYRWGAFPCLLSVALLAIWLGRAAVARAGLSGRPALVLRGTIVAICLFNPTINDALYYGHPEELLTSSLAVAGLLAVIDERITLGALLMGCAIASKQWAILMVVPVLFTLHEKRIRFVLIAGGVAGAATLPLLVANPEAFRYTLKYLSNPQPVVTVYSWLYPFSPEHWITIANPFGDHRHIIAHQLPGIGTLARPLIMLLSVGVPLAIWWPRRSRFSLDTLLPCLALVFVLRCALDPGSAGYYHLPIVLTLLAWDALRGRRLPVAGLIAWGVTFVVLDRMPNYFPEAVTSAVYMTASVGACVVLLRQLGIGRRRVPATPGGLRLKVSPT